MASCTQNRKHSLLSALSAHWQEQADQIRLELSDVDVEGAVEAERRRQGRDHLRQKAVKVRVRRPLDVQVPAADIWQSIQFFGFGISGNVTSTADFLSVANGHACIPFRYSC